MQPEYVFGLTVYIIFGTIIMTYSIYYFLDHDLPHKNPEVGALIEAGCIGIFMGLAWPVILTFVVISLILRGFLSITKILTYRVVKTSARTKL